MRRVQSKSRTHDADPARDESFREILAEAIEIAERSDVPYLVGGSLASNTWGRPSRTGDVDLIIDPRSAKPLLRAFEEAGYTPEETYPQWLFKARKDGITVDLIFEMAGPLYLEPQMIERGSKVEILGTKLCLISPEDFVLSQAMALKEDTAVYWFNALGVIARQDLDWEYLIDMAQRGPRRFLALLLLAQAEDLPVPDSVIRRIFENTFAEQE
ncbi:MAG TPA: nucleotidyltransferase [Actinomycetota bacterium]|nr:nucleotidyltransferase [Actinomycetota bacterium]